MSGRTIRINALHLLGGALAVIALTAFVVMGGGRWCFSSPPPPSRDQVQSVPSTVPKEWEALADMELGLDGGVRWKALVLGFRRELSEQGPFLRGPEATQIHEEAWRLARENDLDAALAEVTKAREAHPADEGLMRDESCLYCLLGWRRYNSKEFDTAGAAFGKSLKIWPQNPYALEGAGIVSYQKKDIRTAIDYLETLVNQTSEVPESFLFLGMAYYEQERLEEAIRFLEYYLAVRPDSAEARMFLDKIRRESRVEDDFTVKAGRHFDIKYDGAEDPEAAGIVEDMCDEAYFEVSNELDYTPERTITVILYTNQQFQNVTLAPAWAGAVFDGKIRLPTRGIEADDQVLQGNIYHEFTHALLFDCCGLNVPTWFHEGTAMVMQGFEGEEANQFAGAVLFRNGGLVPLSNLEKGFTTMNERQAMAAYLESYFAVRYIFDYYGIQAVRQIIRRLKAGDSIQGAIKTASGDDYATFERDFMEWARDYNPR